MNPTGGTITIDAQHLACFTLAGRLLREGLFEERRFYRYGITCEPSHSPVVLRHEEMADFVHEHINALSRWTDELARVMNCDFPHAMHPPQSTATINRVCDSIILFGRRIVSWEHSVAAPKPPPHWNRVMSLLRGMTAPLATCLFQQNEGIAALPARVLAGDRDIDLRVKVPSLPQFHLLASELPRAFRAGTPFYHRHPILTAAFLGALLAR
jgi:hypothetical protein